MGSREYERRDVLKTGAGLATVGLVGGLSGCSALEDGNAEAAEDDGEGDKTAASVTADVPARANVVVETDFQALLEDDALRSAVNDGLSEGMQRSDGMPTSVDAIFNSVEEETEVDPRQLQQTVLFAEGESQDTAETAYAGYLVYSNWSGDVIRGKIEELRAESSADETETEEYGGQTVYVSAEAEQDGRLVVFDDGTVVFGGGGAVYDVIDVRNGETDALSGDVLDAWNAARSGYVRFAFDVDPENLPEGEAQMAGANLENLQYTYGAMYPDGDVRGIEFNMQLGSETEAEDAVSLIENGLLMAASDAEDEQTREFIENTEVSADGATVTARNEVSVDKIVPVVREFVRGLVLGFTSRQVSEASDTLA